MTVYMVTFNGYHEDYGSRIYLLGIYSSREKAEEAVKKAVDDMKAMSDEYDSSDNEATINEIDLDESHRIFEAYSTFMTDICLGGYVE